MKMKFMAVLSSRKIGYVEEEYFVSGTANVSNWPAPGTATIRVANAPYTTRMLVRRKNHRLPCLSG